MSVKLLTEHHLEFLSLKGGRTGLSESFHVKMPHCWQSHVTAYMCVLIEMLPMCNIRDGSSELHGNCLRCFGKRPLMSLKKK